MLNEEKSGSPGLSFENLTGELIRGLLRGFVTTFFGTNTQLPTTNLRKKL
jgi:hypothetical protein